MGNVVTIRSRPDDRAKSARVGMMVFLATWAMMFAGLLFAFVFVRIDAEAWPPPDAPALPRTVPAISSLALLASCGLIELGRRAIKRNGSKVLAASWYGAAGLVGVFVVLQGVLFVTCRSAGLKGAFGGLFLMYVLFQGVGAIAGIPGVLVVANRARAGRYGALQHVGPSLWATYWYVVAVAWLLIYAGVYWV
ncbi:MAG: cytochrome c oxidase subunit 3 [Myxococcaceae bacterium]